MSQRGDVLVPEDCEAVFVHSGPVRLLAMPMSLLRVLQSLPGALVPGLVVLLFMGFRGATMSVSGGIVLLGGFPVRLVHGVSSRGSVGDRSSCARGGPIYWRSGMALHRRNSDEHAIRWAGFRCRLCTGNDRFCTL
jgi:hypothetical protein